MPNYPGAQNATAPVVSNLSPIAIGRGESVFVIGALAATATQLPINDSNSAFEAAGQAVQPSIAVCLVGDGGVPPSVCVEVIWNGAPGAGESIAVQEADTDADAFYINPANPAYTLNSPGALNTQRADLSPTGGKFMRVVRTKGANAVGCKVKITRLA